MKNAYAFACQVRITTMDNILKANVYSPVTRAAFAKMISSYAQNILKKSPDRSKSCHFEDLDQTNAELAGYIVTACQYGIMGVNMRHNMFYPNRGISRAEVVTILSRLHNWASDSVPYYKDHMQQMVER